MQPTQWYLCATSSATRMYDAPVSIHSDWAVLFAITISLSHLTPKEENSAAVWVDDSICFAILLIGRFPSSYAHCLATWGSIYALQLEISCILSISYGFISLSFCQFHYCHACMVCHLWGSYVLEYRLYIHILLKALFSNCFNLRRLIILIFNYLMNVQFIRWLNINFKFNKKISF